MQDDTRQHNNKSETHDKTKASTITSTITRTRRANTRQEQTKTIQ